MEHDQEFTVSELAAPELVVLYEDNHLLALDKPSGLSTQPSKEHPVALETLAKDWIKVRDKKEAGVYLHAIHRLDRVTSGIVIFAKTSKALSRLQDMMRQHAIDKYYLAKVESPFLEEKGTLKNYLVHLEHHSIVLDAPNDPEAKYSELDFQVIKRSVRYTLLEIHLKTGRYHQIRAQLAHHGFPIVGDRKYGSDEIYPDDHIELHHYKTEFMHPTKKEKITIQSPKGLVFFENSMD